MTIEKILLGSSLTLLLASCADMSLRHPSTAGLSSDQTVKLVAGSSEPNFSCAIRFVDDTKGESVVPFNLAYKADVTLLPGIYTVAVRCGNGVAFAEPRVTIKTEAGHTYRLTGHLTDGLHMRVNVTTD